MTYQENGEKKSCMVKVNLCAECAVKLNYKKFKDKVKKEMKKKDKKKKRRRKEERKGSSSSKDDSD